MGYKLETCTVKHECTKLDSIYHTLSTVKECPQDATAAAAAAVWLVSAVETTHHCFAHK